VLVALCGLTPQVVTETLWALRQQRPPVVPKEIRIVTTRSGRDACERLLLGKRGKLAAYLKEYKVRAISCVPQNVVTLKGSDNRDLEDVRTQADNLAVADQIAAVIRELTARPNVRLHCSVTGGRKTMGVLLAAILQVYGRPDDRLYHVLVSSAFESHPDFFYIPKRRQVITVSGKRLDMAQARIELAEIPYVRLRAFLPPDLLKKSLPFTELVSLAQKHLRALETPEPVRVDTASQRLLVANANLHLSPAQMRLYTALARIKIEYCVERRRQTCGECIACYPIVSKANWDTVREQLETLAGDAFLWPSDPDDPGIAPARFRSLVTKTNTAIARGFGANQLAERYCIKSAGPRGETRYGLAADKTLIRIES